MHSTTGVCIQSSSDDDESLISPSLDNDSQCSTAEEHPSSHLGKAAVQAGFILLEMVPTMEGEEKDAK